MKPARRPSGEAMSVRERGAKFRARQKALGLEEVRGVWLPKKLHPRLKQLAKDMLGQ